MVRTNRDNNRGNIYWDWIMKEVSFKGYKGYVVEPKKYSTAVIFLHGFPSSIDGSSAKWHRQGLKKYLVFTPDFSNGKHSGKFENKLMSKEVKDIKKFIDYLEKNYSYKKLVIIGHSTGAIDLALYAHKDKRIDKVILSGAVASLKRGVRYDFDSLQVHSFWTKGYVRYNRPGKWVHGKKIKKAFYDEFFKLDIPKAIKKYRKPLLIIHGEKDEAVPLSEARELFSIANKPKRLVVIKNADHRFSKHLKKYFKQIKKFINE